MDQKPVNYALQFAMLIGFMGIAMMLCAFLVTGVGMAVMHVPALQVPKELNKPEYINLSRILNTVSALLIFLVPTWVVARRLDKNAFRWIGFNAFISPKQVMLILALTVPCILLSGALGDLNEWIPLPKNLYTKARELENTYKEAMMGMALMKTFTDYVVAIVVIAVAPAIFEEVLFRGGFQQILIGWTKNKWAGIILTSIIFSAIHFSYFGFLPRFALGMVLGLIFQYSKNIWLNILLHFLNNALVVTQLYFLTLKGKPIDKAMDDNVPMWWGLIALVILVVLFRLFKKESDQVQEEKIQIEQMGPEIVSS